MAFTGAGVEWTFMPAAGGGGGGVSATGAGGRGSRGSRVGVGVGVGQGSGRVGTHPSSSSAVLSANHLRSSSLAVLVAAAGQSATWDARSLAVPAFTDALQALPTQIAANLKTLSISRNLLDALPVQPLCDANRFRKLRRIVANANHIAVVPEELGLLASSLEEVWLNENVIRELPCALAKLVNLQVLSVDGNPLTGTAGLASDVTLLSVWQGAGPSSSVKRRTARMLEHLRQNMAPEVRTEVERMLQTKTRREATSAAREAFCAGDRTGLEKALASLASSGEAEAKLAALRSEVRILAALEDETADIETLRTSLEAWASRVAGAKVVDVAPRGGCIRVLLTEKGGAATGAIALAVKVHNRKVRESAVEARKVREQEQQRQRRSTNADVAKAEEEQAEEEQAENAAWSSWMEKKRQEKERNSADLAAFRRRVRAEDVSRKASRQAQRPILEEKESNWSDILAKPKDFYKKKEPRRRSRSEARRSSEDTCETCETTIHIPERVPSGRERPPFAL